MKNYNLLVGIIIALISFSACNDETLDIGGSLTQSTDKLTVNSANYPVRTRTVIADSVLLRANHLFLGRVKDPETGAYVTGEFTTQFSVLEKFALPNEQNIYSQYDNMAGADSCQIELYMKPANSTTDTLSAIKINAAELSVPISEDAIYYSNFDPKKEGLIRQGGVSKDKMFVYNDLTVDASLRANSSYINVIRILLNDPYTDKNGKTYNNYGTYILQQYYRHPEYFQNSYAFITNVCPGFNISVVDGNDVYAEMMEMGLRLFYRAKNDNDSIVDNSTVFAGTEEVLQTVKISNEKEMLQKLADDNTCTYIKSPAGLYTEVTLPVDDVFSSNDTDSLMSASISFQRLNSLVKDKPLAIPSFLLMVPKDSLSSFFEKKRQVDNMLYYYSANNTTNQYSFSNISALITKMYKAKKQGLKTDNNWISKHSDWNKVLLVPISVKSTSSNSSNVTPTNFDHESSITSTKLVGGSDNPFSPIMLNVVYGKFSQ